MSRKLAILGAVASLVLTACGQKAPTATTDGVPEESVAKFLMAMDDFNPDAVRELFTPNAKLMPPNVASISGIDNIIDYYKGALADELDFEFTREASGMSSGLAAAEGAYKVKNLVTGEYIEEGKWMAVWVNVDGTWRVARLMSNTDAPVRAPVVGVDDTDGE